MRNPELALILAAGMGRRLNGLSGETPKPVMKLHGFPVLEHVMLSAHDAGIKRFLIVVGYQAETLRRWLVGRSFQGAQVTCVENPEYWKDNGISVLAAKHLIHQPFLLLMADHIFEPETAAAILQQPLGKNEVILGVDRKLDCIFDLDDATKVQRMDFDALEAVSKEGNCSLSQGMQYMASNRKLRAYDIEDAYWQDIDTPEMYKFARRHFLPKMWTSERFEEMGSLA
jgi:1L-myo-inositol 1-phosphate cytidylyltransferase